MIKSVTGDRSVVFTGSCGFQCALYIEQLRDVWLVFSTVDLGFEPQSDKTKDYKIGICFFSSKHAALMSKVKDW